jgi:hypothetical protein
MKKAYVLIASGYLEGADGEQIDLKRSQIQAAMQSVIEGVDGVELVSSSCEIREVAP